MNDTPWFLYANILVWLGLGGYLFLLCRRVGRLEARLRRLEHASGVKNGETGE